MIPQDTIDKILDAADIKEVVGEFVTLKRRGVNLVACCPFHSENTPSFTVFPKTGTYKCFGCGEQGNSVGFLMKHENLTYPEALKWLAKKYNIEIKERILTPQEEQEHKQREAMWIANDYLSKEYVKQLHLPQNKAARDYAYKRWGERYCSQVGIGYCPKDARIVEDSYISEDVANALHIRNKGGYDFFNGRITIPIRDRQQHIIGFTSRVLDDSKPKYMNSSDSAIYNKSKSVFGIDCAWREASKSGRVYMVEGAPDCMRLQSIGIYNTVATLGTAWTEDHFALLKRVASHVCFLPDADPPKEGEQFSPGIAGVIKSGEAAMRYGFSVSVKQIPVTEEKQDPDTFCTNANIFNSIEEKDFVIWYADLLFVENMTTEEQSKVVTKLADILALITDETTIEMYISQLTKYGQPKRVWQKAIDKQRKIHQAEEAKAKAEKEEGLFKRYGFNVEKNKYYSIGDKGYYEWSNFCMEPLFHIKDSIMPKRLYILRNTFGMEELVELKQEDLVSLSKFKQKVEGLGNFIWMATEKELTKLKSYLYEKTETAIQIIQMGWQRQGFFAFGNGVFYDGSFIKVDEYGIVRLIDKGNFYLPAHSKIYCDDTKLFQFERRFVHLNLSTTPLRQFTDQIFRVFGNNGKVGFCFYLATLFRDEVTRETRSFPILNLFGPKGSGKSELGHTLMSFFVTENVPPNIQNSTLPALNDTIAAVANALVHIDEFKNDIDINKREFLKGLWDGTGRTRMNMELDKKKETTAVDSGVILSGQEMATADIALFSRLIFLSFPKSEFTQEEKDAYQQLKKMRQPGMSHLTLQVLSFRNKVEQSFRQMYQMTFQDVMDRLKDAPIEDRIMINWLSPLAILRTLESYLDISISYKEMLEITIEGIRNQNAECRQNNELASFWNMVQYLVSEGEIIEGGDFRIQYVRRFSSSIVKCEWLESRPVLYIQKTRIFMLYKKHGKAVGDTLLPEGSLKYYLEKSKAYLGEKSARYYVYYKGVIQYEKDRKNADGSLMKQSTTQRSYCFDYQEIVKAFDINLEKARLDAVNDTLDDLEDKVPQPKQSELDFGE